MGNEMVLLMVIGRYCSVDGQQVLVSPCPAGAFIGFVFTVLKVSLHPTGRPGSWLATAIRSPL